MKFYDLFGKGGGQVTGDVFFLLTRSSGFHFICYLSFINKKIKTEFFPVLLNVHKYAQSQIWSLLSRMSAFLDVRPHQVVLESKKKR